MKYLISCIFILVIVQCFSQQLYTLEADEQPVTEVLKELEEAYGLKFSFNAKRLAEYDVVASITTNDPARLMEELLKYIPYKATQVEGVYLIIPDRNKKIELPTISGRVIDAQTGAPLAFAHIEADEKGGISDLDGRFQLKSIKRPEEIQVSFVGYTSKIVPLKTDLSSLTISLESDTSHLPEFIINANTHLMEHTDVSSFHINTTQIASLPSLGQQDIFKSLQLIPGISATDETNAGMTVRGSGSEQNLVLMDGFSVYHLDHLFGLYSSFNPYTVDQINLHKGGFNAKYGGRISSVIDSRMKAPNTQRTKGGVNINPTSLNFYVESPLGKKLSFISSFRRSSNIFFQSSVYKDFIQNNRVSILDSYDPTSESDPITFVPEFGFYDLNTKLRYRPSDNDFIDFNVYLSEDFYEGSYEDGFSDESFEYEYKVLDLADWGNLGSSLNWTRFNSNEVSTNLNLSISAFTSTSESVVSDSYSESLFFTDEFGNEFIEDFDTSYVYSDLDKSNDLTDISIKWDQKRRLSSSNQLEYGAEVNRIDVAYSISYFEELSEKFDDQGLIYSGFGQYDFSEGDLDISAGLRASYYSNTEQSYMEPRIAAKYQLGPATHLKAAYSIHHQFLNRLSITPFGNNDQFYWVLTDDDYYPVMRSQHLIAGINYQKDGWTLDLEAYHKDNSGILESEFIIYNEPFFDVAFETFEEFINDGTNKTLGVDVFLKKRSENFTSWLSYSLASSMNTFTSINDGRSYPSLLDQRHEINWVNQYQIKKWEFGSTFIVGSGRPFTPPNPNATENGILYDISQINKGRLPLYHRLDVSVKYNTNVGRFNVSSGVTLFNVYNRSNIKSRRYTLFYPNENIAEIFDGFDPSEEQAPEVIPIDINLLGFTPNFFIDIRF